MTQRKAVVPVDEDVHSVETLDFDNKTVDLRSVNACKLTKEDVEMMAEAHFNSRQHHIKEFTGFDGPKWADVDADTQELGRRDMISALKASALKAIGIEVEE